MQSGSGAIRCHHVQSGASRCNQVSPGSIRSNQVQSGAIRCNQVQSGVIRFRCYQVQCTWNALTLHCTSLKITTFSPFPTDQICHQAFQEIFRPSSWCLIPLIRWEISLTKREGKISSLKKLLFIHLRIWILGLGSCELGKERLGLSYA